MCESDSVSRLGAGGDPLALQSLLHSCLAWVWDTPVSPLWVGIFLPFFFFFLRDVGAAVCWGYITCKQSPVYVPDLPHPRPAFEPSVFSTPQHLLADAIPTWLLLCFCKLPAAREGALPSPQLTHPHPPLAPQGS